MSRIIKEFSFIGSSSLVGQVFSVFTVVILAREMSAEDYGKLTLVFVPILALPIIFNFGVPNAVFRFYNTTKDYLNRERVVSTAFYFVLFITSLFGLALQKASILFTLPVYFDGLTNKIIILTCVISLSNVLSVTLRADREYRIISYINILNPFIKLCLIGGVVILNDLNFNGVLSAHMISESLVLIFLYIKTRGIRLSRVSYQTLKNLLKYGFAFVPHRFFTKATRPLLQVLIARTLGVDYTGYFAFAEKLVLPLSFLIDKIQFIWEPIKFELHTRQDSRNIFIDIIESFVLILLVFSSLYGLLILLFFPISFFPEYEQSRYIAYALVLVSFLRGIYYFFGTGIELASTMFVLPFSSGGGLLILIGLNLLFEILGILNINLVLISMVISELYSITLVRISALKKIQLNIPRKTMILLVFYISSFSLNLVMKSFELLAVISVFQVVIISMVSVVYRNKILVLRNYSNI